MPPHKCVCVINYMRTVSSTKHIYKIRVFQKNAKASAIVIVENTIGISIC